MAKNKKTHHRPGPGKPRGATYAQVLAHKAAVRKGLEQAARDATVQVQADTHTQRAMWLMVLHRRRLRLRPQAAEKVFLCSPGQHGRAGADAG